MKSLDKSCRRKKARDDPDDPNSAIYRRLYHFDRIQHKEVEDIEQKMFLSEPSFFLSLPSPLLSFFSLEIILEKIFGLLPVTFFSQIERHEVCSNMICHWRKTGCQKDDDMMRTKSRRVKERVSERM